MATFPTLPLEIHDSIAKHCDQNDLFNLCCTSKWLNESCLPVLYRHVDLRHDGHGVQSNYKQDQTRLVDEGKQERFAHTLQIHPEYGKHVRSFKGTLCVPSSHTFHITTLTDEQFWRALQSLTHVQIVDLGSRNRLAYRMTSSMLQPPINLFRSATSVTLVGRIQYDLAKSILGAINPATLQYLCLDMVQECEVGETKRIYVPGDRDENGRIIALGAVSGLLTTLTGGCTALRTLILRRIGQRRHGHGWHALAEEASYIEWASFIRSVQGTVEKFKFEHAGDTVRERLYPTDEPLPLRIMDERFRRLILPTIVSGNWPHLTRIELQGVRSVNDQVGNATLAMELRDFLGENLEIVVEEKIHYVKGLLG